MNIFELQIGSFTLAPQYYGLMYALSFIIAFFLLRRESTLSPKKQEDLLFLIFLGVILGGRRIRGRLGYVLFYNFTYYTSHLSEILQFWKWGMSFHGGVIGVIISMYVFARKHGESFLGISDQIVWMLPIGLGLGRFGNYLNKELLGHEGYTGPLAITAHGSTYFPTPLLEMMLEGGILFGILLFVRKYQKYPGQIGVWFLFWYGVFRIGAELARDPDPQIWYIGILTLGQILSIIMILCAMVLHFLLKRPRCDRQK